jgi:hypothetical protein
LNQKDNGNDPKMECNKKKWQWVVSKLEHVYFLSRFHSRPHKPRWHLLLPTRLTRNHLFFVYPLLVL